MNTFTKDYTLELLEFYLCMKVKQIPEDVTKWFWETCKDAADYMFNLSHGASYSYLTAYTTYLKANHPLEFFLGCLRMAQHEGDSIECYNKIQSEMRDMGLKLLPPNNKNEEPCIINSPELRVTKDLPVILKSPKSF